MGIRRTVNDYIFTYRVLNTRPSRQPAPPRQDKIEDRNCRFYSAHQCVIVREDSRNHFIVRFGNNFELGVYLDELNPIPMSPLGHRLAKPLGTAEEG